MNYDIVLNPNTMQLQDDGFGDFLLGDNTNNCILAIIVSNPGDWKQYPFVGVGIYNFLQSISNPAQIEQAIIKQMKADIFPNPSVNANKFPIINVNGTQIKII